MITKQGDAVQGTWAPSGKRIAYLTTTQPTTMWTIDPDGANAYDPRYGQADLWQTGTQGKVSVKFMF